MFTGIVEGLAKVVEMNKKKDFQTISIDLGEFCDCVKVGDSVALNGACMTVTNVSNTIASFDIMHESLKKTDLGDLVAGSQVNIERPLKIGDRLDGHFVLGHVDGVAKIIDKKITEDNCDVWIELPNELEYGLIPKGSIGIDGISLTIVGIDENKFSVSLIPHTLSITTLGIKKAGDKVNIEIDYIGKWIKKINEKNI